MTWESLTLESCKHAFVFLASRRLHGRFTGRKVDLSLETKMKIAALPLTVGGFQIIYSNKVSGSSAVIFSLTSQNKFLLFQKGNKSFEKYSFLNF